MNKMQNQKLLLAPNKSPEVRSGFYHDKYPLMASAKFDGVRAVITPDGIYSRNWKRFNSELEQYFEDAIAEARKNNSIIDGEIYSRNLRFDQLISNIRGNDINESIRFYAFDSCTLDEWNNQTTKPFKVRYDETVRRYRHLNRVAPVVQYQINNDNDLEILFGQSIDQGFEGLIMRNPESQYKNGRATMRQNIIYKLKQWVTIDSKIVGFKQMMKGGKRTAKIGSFLLRSSDGIEYAAKPAAGLTLDDTWCKRDQYLGGYVECRFMKHGVKLRPRFAHITRLRPDLADGDNIETLADVLGA